MCCSVCSKLAVAGSHTHALGCPGHWLTQQNRISGSVTSNLLPLAIFPWRRAHCFADLYFYFIFWKTWDDNGYLAYMLVGRSYFKALCKYKNVSQNCRVIQMLYHLAPSGSPSKSTAAQADSSPISCSHFCWEIIRSPLKMVTVFVGMYVYVNVCVAKELCSNVHILEIMFIS